ncbi:MAG: sugar ABC transporter permease [Clostridiales bacterium]|jgi:multiple sugar transport system permease protein|nr:sugar ABC transporter permease [Clostridiales bacterium]
MKKQAENIAKKSTKNPSKQTAISKKAAGGLLFILPGLLGFVLFYIVPFFISLFYSFLSKPIGGYFVGFTNFIGLFNSGPYKQGFTNTMLFIGICVPLNMALSLLAALAINKTGKYKSLFTLIFLIPLVIPSGSTVFFWRNLFSLNGYINGLLNQIGIEKINWLNSPSARYVIVFIFIWKNLGYNIVLFLAGLSNIPKEYYEAAGADGAGKLRCLSSITLPCLLPTTVLILIMSIINSFKVFKEIFMLMDNYPHESVYMLQHFMNNMFQSVNYPRLTTATTILVICITFLTQMLFKLERKVTDE